MQKTSTTSGPLQLEELALQVSAIEVADAYSFCPPLKPLKLAQQRGVDLNVPLVSVSVHDTLDIDDRLVIQFESRAGELPRVTVAISVR